MVGGAWGVIATGLFSAPARMEAWLGRDTDVGWFYEWGRGSGNFTLIGIQLIAVLFIFSWTFVVMGVYFWVLNRFDMLRIDPLEEEVGMDISRHKGSAYDLDAVDSKFVEDLSQRRATSLNDSSSRRGSFRSKKQSPVITDKKVVADEEQPAAPEQPAADDEPAMNVVDPASADKTD
jgi:Amt family ammonium transporter